MNSLSPIAFASTKIQPPRARQSLVPRPALEGRLAAAVGHARLVLLCAPAGFGKTAALARLLTHLAPGTATAWVALDDDDDLGRCAACLVAALEPYDLPWRTSPDALVQAAQDGTRAARLALCTVLVNALAACGANPGLLVFDDVHRVADPAVFDFLESVVERLPDGWTAVLASRTDPPLAMARWRAAGEVLELRQEDLAFRPQEAVAVAVSRAPALTAEDALALYERTQGWPAGLGLLLQDGGARGAQMQGSLRDRTVFEYFASEVLEGMPPAPRSFLLRCAVLPEMSAARCAAVSGDPDAADRLADIERRGLFVSLIAADPPTLRLHDLFRDFLIDRLRRDDPEGHAAALHRAADTEADPVRRLGFLLRGGDWQQAEAGLVANAREMLAAGDVSGVLRLLHLFPDAYVHASGELSLVRAMAAWAQWDWAPMLDGAERAVAIFAAAGNADRRRRATSFACVALSATNRDEECRCRLAALMAEPLDTETRCCALLVQSWQALTQGQAAVLAASWSALVATLDAHADLALWYECSPLPSFVGLPRMRPALVRYVAGARGLLPDQPVPLAGMLQVMQGWLQLWVGDRPTALSTLAAAEQDCRWLGNPINLHTQLLMLHAMAAALSGDRAGTAQASQAWMDIGESLPRGPRRDGYLTRLGYYAGRVAFLCGDAEGARHWLRLLATLPAAGAWQIAPDYVALADAYLADIDGRIDDACRLWQRCIDGDHGTHVFGQQAEIRLRLASEHVAVGRFDEAAALVVPALEQWEESGECGPALTAGPQVLERLAKTRWGLRLEPGRVQRLVHLAELALAWRLPSAAAAITAITQPATSTTSAPILQGPSSGRPTAPAAPLTRDFDLLSNRELDVLRRIAAGDSNKQIARVFDLSPHTVKRHVSNILDKLGVDTRGAAAAWLHARGGAGA